MSGSLSGVRVVVGRPRPGALADLLIARGAEVVHLPLLAERDPSDGGVALRAELAQLDRYDWLLVSSVPGADRVGRAARRHPAVRLGAVGTTTAKRLAELAGRSADLVPARQKAAELARELLAIVPARSSFLVAAADRSDGQLGDELAAAGHHVSTVVAYRTVLTPPDPDDLPPVDALLLTSGSMAESWVAGVGAARVPPIVVAIGPSTAGVAHDCGLQVTAVAEEHSLSGLVCCLEQVVGGRSGL